MKFSIPCAKACVVEASLVAVGSSARQFAPGWKGVAKR